MRRRLPPAVAFVVFLAILGPIWAPAEPAPEEDPVRGSTRTLRGRYVIAAAGDISCDSHPGSDPASCQHDNTARLIDGRRLLEVLTLGDNQYDRGEYENYRRYFDPTWGRARRNMSPVPGNHEYPDGPTSRPRGYFRYFGNRVRGPHNNGYYSYDLGACPDQPCWHMVALNSELCQTDVGCNRPADPSNPDVGERMFTWLRRDLRRHPNSEYRCTLAYWHHPLHSFSTSSASSSEVRPLWKLLHRAKADIVLNGHSHNYQRWRPMAPDGSYDRRGIRQFIVGTGGKSKYEIRSGSYPSNLKVAQADSFGVLMIKLKARGYHWEWVTARGQPRFSDSSNGISRCF